MISLCKLKIKRHFILAATPCFPTISKPPTATNCMFSATSYFSLFGYELRVHCVENMKGSLSHDLIIKLQTTNNFLLVVFERAFKHIHLLGIVRTYFPEFLTYFWYNGLIVTYNNHSTFEILTELAHPSLQWCITFSAFTRESIVSRSRWLVGSSSNNKWGSAQPNSAKATRLFWPPERH